MSSSHRGSELVAACSAAFAVGCSLGALGMRYYEQHYARRDEQQHEQPRLTAAALAPLESAGLASPAPSMCSYSLPPTPRMNGRDTGASLGRSTSAAGGGSGEGLRMVFVVRRDLGWNRQKLAVMTAHACVALFKKLFKARNPALMQWELAKGPKLVLRADDEAALMAVLNAARSSGIPHHCIAEAGPSSGSSARSSDVGGGSSGGALDVPRRSRTILALGPLPAEDIAKFAPGLVLL